MSSPYSMRVGLGEVARGSVGDRILVTDKGVSKRDEALVPRAPSALAIGVPDPQCPPAVLAVHTKTTDELLALLREWDENSAAGHPGEEKCVGIRLAQTQTSGGIDLPELSETRQNRFMLLATGPDATKRIRLRRPLPNGDTKVVVELLPGDLVENGIYAAGEVPVEQILRGREIIIFNARDITQVIRSQELDKLYAEADATSEAIDVTPSKEQP